MKKENFNFLEFVSSLKDLAVGDQRIRVQHELDRTRNLQIREPSWQFQQQIYVRHLERLLHCFESQKVTSELTPSEKRAYTLLTESAGLAKT